MNARSETMRTVVPLASLSAEQITEVASLHIRTMSTLLSDLGLPIVRKYYEIASRDPAVIGLCAIDGGHVVGYAVGTPDPGRLFGFVRSPVYWFAWQLLGSAFVRPDIIRQIVVSLVRSSQHAVRHGEIELTYIGIAPEFRGSGRGRQMLEEFCTRAGEAGHRAIVLSVETDNAAARAIYSKAGFRVIDTFREGRFDRHRMARSLESVSDAFTVIS